MRSNIVGIKGNTLTTTSKPLPQVLIKLRDLYKHRVHSLLLKLFENADDALFAMADKAGTSGEQAIYFDAMRELRLQRKAIATTVLQTVIKSFNELGVYRTKSCTVNLTGDGQGGFSLLQNDDLELKVAVEGMIAKVRNESGSSLEELRLRCDALMSPTSLEMDQIPGSPETLCDAFVEGCDSLEADIKAKIVLLKLYEKYVVAKLSEMYKESNSMLVSAGVLPSLNSKSVNAGAPTQKTTNRFQEGDSNAELASNSSNSVTTQDETRYGNSYELETIRQLLHPNRPMIGDGEPPLLETHSYSQKELVGALSQAQAELYGDNVFVLPTENSLIDFRSLLKTRLDNTGLTSTYNEMDEDIINLVSMLFEFILDDRQLPAEMKALIGRLQIPILKVALLDRTFFSKGGHPARKLLNEIASAALGWTKSADGRKDRLSSKIEKIVEQILSGFDEKLDMFEMLLEDFVAFIDKEKRRGALVEQRTKDSEAGKAANEVARKETQEVLNAAMAGKQIPSCVVEILRDGWSNLMVLHYLKDGVESSNWQEDCALVSDLIWSVCPTVQEGDLKTKLLRMIPGVIKRVREGLQEASFDEFRAKALLSDLEQEHLKTVGSIDVPVQEDVSSSSITADAAALDVSAEEYDQEAQDDMIAELVRSTVELEKDFQGGQSNSDLSEEVETQEVSAAESISEESKIVLVASDEESKESIAEDSPFVQQVDRFAPGCWFEFAEDEQSERCKLAAVIKATGKYIFVNRAGVKVAEKTRLGLAEELQQGTLQVLNDGLLFDRALESIISNLQTKS